jgi:hypothetical protein
MSRKVIYVSWIPLTEKVSRDWFIDYLISKEIAVEFWDVSYFFRGELNQAGTLSPSYSHTFKSYNEVKTKLKSKENSDALFVMLISYDGRRAFFYRLFSKYSCRMLYIRWGVMPVTYIAKHHKILSRLDNPFKLIADIFYIIKAKFYQKLKLVKPFEIVFAAGQSCMSDNYCTKMVPINLCDFDNHKILINSRLGRLVKEKYAVYLDTFLPFQSDLKVDNRPVVTPDLFYSSLNHFFQLIEKKYKVKVVIAAHPKSDYKTDVFNGRQILYGHTPRLVKDSEYVITEMSTAVSYAVINRKPLFFIYNDEMNVIYKDSVVHEIKSIAKSLGEPVYNSDSIKECSQIKDPKINKDLYNLFKYLYLTSPDAESHDSNKIFLSEIKKLFRKAY